jgi:hypothetical protein
MGTVLIVVGEVALLIGAILISNLVKVKPVPIKVRADSDRNAR